MFATIFTNFYNFLQLGFLSRGRDSSIVRGCGEAYFKQGVIIRSSSVKVYKLVRFWGKCRVHKRKDGLNRWMRRVVIVLIGFLIWSDDSIKFYITMKERMGKALDGLYNLIKSFWIVYGERSSAADSFVKHVCLQGIVWGKNCQIGVVKKYL